MIYLKPNDENMISCRDMKSRDEIGICLQLDSPFELAKNSLREQILAEWGTRDSVSWFSAKKIEEKDYVVDFGNGNLSRIEIKKDPSVCFEIDETVDALFNCDIKF